MTDDKFGSTNHKKMFYDLVNNLQDGYSQLDLEGRIIFLNTSALKILKINKLEDVLNKSAQDLFYKEKDARQKLVLQMVNNGFIKKQPITLKRSDGTFVDVEQSSYFFYDSAGNRIGIESIFRDITEYKLIEKNLHESEENFNNFVETTAISIIFHDGENILYANQAALKSLEYTKEDFYKIKLSQIIHEDYREVAAERAKNRMVNPTHENPHYELKLVSKNDKIVWMTISSCAITFKGKKVIAVSGHNATEQKLKEIENEQLQKGLIQTTKLASLGTMGAGIAHELKNPLSIIKGFVDMIHEEATNNFKSLDNQSTIQTLSKVQEQIDRMTKIINQIRDFSRDAERQPSEQLLPDKLIEETMILLNEQLRNKNINVKINCEKNLPAFWGNKVKIESVLQNLITNARDALLNHTPKDNKPKEILINSYIRNNNIVFEVEDNGKGIPEKDLLKIFDPFFTTKEVGKGTGLGLSIAYGIIQEHGGTIEVESKLQEGTKFSIYLPIDRRKLYNR